MFHEFESTLVLSMGQNNKYYIDIKHRHTIMFSLSPNQTYYSGGKKNLE